MRMRIERSRRKLDTVGNEAFLDVEPRCDFFVGGGERLKELSVR